MKNAKMDGVERKPLAKHRFLGKKNKINPIHLYTYTANAIRVTPLKSFNIQTHLSFIFRKVSLKGGW